MDQPQNHDLEKGYDQNRHQSQESFYASADSGIFQELQGILQLLLRFFRRIHPGLRSRTSPYPPRTLESANIQTGARVRHANNIKKTRRATWQWKSNLPPNWTTCWQDVYRHRPQ